MATVLRLLQPVEKSWKKLGYNLLKKDLQFKLDNIEEDSFNDKTSKKALDDVFSKWLNCTLKEKRTWQTLCNTAKKHGDESLENYVQENDNFKSKFQFVTRSMNNSILYKHN